MSPIPLELCYISLFSRPKKNLDFGHQQHQTAHACPVPVPLLLRRNVQIQLWREYMGLVALFGSRNGQKLYINSLPNSFFLAAKLVPMYQVSTIYQVLPSRHSRLPSRHSRHLPSLASWCHDPTQHPSVSKKRESPNIKMIKYYMSVYNDL